MTEAPVQVDAVDRAIINGLQGGFPVGERPYATAARSLGIGEEELISRLRNLLAQKVLTRFGPMYNVERMGGEFILAALHAEDDRFAEITDIVNAYPEVAHNYRREHELNMWFVVAAGSKHAAREVLDRIEEQTGCRVYAMPKIKEYFVGLHFEV